MTKKAETQQPGPLLRYVVMPLAQGLTAGFATALLAMTLTSVACLALEWPAKLVPIATGFAFGVTAGITVLMLLWKSNQFFYAIERALGIDLPFGPTHDSQVGEPKGPTLTYVSDGGRSHRAALENLDFGWWLEQIYEHDAGTTWRDWKGKRLPSGNRIEQDQWSDWCQRLINVHLATREYETAPLELRGTLAHARASFMELWLPAP